MESVVRWVVAIGVGINAVTGAVPAVMALCAKAGVRSHIPTRLLSFDLTLSWPMVIIWLGAMVIYGLSVWLLLSRRRTLFTYASAFALDLFVFVTALGNPDYGTTFSDAQRRTSIAIFVLLTLVGIVIDWLDLRATAPAGGRPGRTRPGGPRPAPG